LRKHRKVTPGVFETEREVIAERFKNNIYRKKKIDVPNNTIRDYNKYRGTKWAALPDAASSIKCILS
jgi:hypothetical protein